MTSEVSIQPYRIPIAYFRENDTVTSFGWPCYVSPEWFNLFSVDFFSRIGGSVADTNVDLRQQVDELSVQSSISEATLASHGASIIALQAADVTIFAALNNMRTEIAVIPQFNPGYLEQRIHDIEVTGAFV
jgi:hypothetical protein